MSISKSNLLVNLLGFCTPRWNVSCLKAWHKSPFFSISSPHLTHIQHPGDLHRSSVFADPSPLHIRPNELKCTYSPHLTFLLYIFLKVVWFLLLSSVCDFEMDQKKKKILWCIFSGNLYVFSALFQMIWSIGFVSVMVFELFYNCKL